MLQYPKLMTRHNEVLQRRRRRLPAISRCRSSMSAEPYDQTVDEGPGGDPGYPAHVASMLARRVGELGRLWIRRGAAAVVAERTDSPAVDVQESDTAAEHIIRTLAAAADDGGVWQEPVMRAGWKTGTDAFWRNASLHQLLKELDAVQTILLSAADEATGRYTGPATARDGLALARRLTNATSLLRLAAAGGYTRVMIEDLRRRYRTIRHDLRNPLGTITTAVAMMDDESLPAETRQNPRMRAMVARNARSMATMISTVLGDEAARMPGFALQSSSLHALACAVRGDLKASVEGIDVVVSDELPMTAFDSAGLELLLKAVVLAVARQAGGRAEVVIDLAQLGEQSATLVVFTTAPIAPERRGMDMAFAQELATRLGGKVTAVGPTRVLVEVPMERMEAMEPAREAAHVDAAGDAQLPPRRASGGNALHDVAREGERPHDQPGRF